MISEAWQEQCTQRQAWLEGLFADVRPSLMLRAIGLAALGIALLVLAMPDEGLAQSSMQELGLGSDLRWRMSCAYLFMGLAWLLLVPTRLPALMGVSWREALIGVAAGVGLFLLARVGAGLALEFVPAVEDEVARLAPKAQPFLGPAGVVPVFALIIPGEEVIWRAGVCLPLMARLGPLRGVALGSAAFALAHWGFDSALLMAAAFGAGVFWGLLAWWRKSLFCALVSHWVWDALMLYAAPLPGLVAG